MGHEEHAILQLKERCARSISPKINLKVHFILRVLSNFLLRRSFLSLTISINADVSNEPACPNFYQTAT